MKTPRNSPEAGRGDGEERMSIQEEGIELISRLNAASSSAKSS